MSRLLPIVALVGGVLAGRSWPLPAPSAPPSERGEVTRSACELGEMAQTVDELRAARDAAADELAAISSALEHAVGLPAAWPAVGDAFTEEAMLAELPANIDADERRVLSMDCSEYPCVVVVQYTAEDLDERLGGQTRLFEELRELGYEVGTSTHSLRPRDDGGYDVYSVFTAHDPGVPEDEARSTFRVGDARP